MKLSKNKKILLTICALIVVIIFFVWIRTIQYQRTLQRTVSEQMTALTLPGESPIYEATINKHCNPGAYQKTYCEWLGVRFYAFSSESLNDKIADLRRLLADKSYTPKYSGFPDDVANQIVNGSIRVEYDSYKFLTINSVVLDCYNPLALNGRNPLAKPYSQSLIKFTVL